MNANAVAVGTRAVPSMQLFRPRVARALRQPASIRVDDLGLALAEAGYLTGGGKPYVASAVQAMLV